MTETTRANRSQNVTEQMKQKTFSLLLPVRAVGHLQHPDIKAN